MYLIVRRYYTITLSDSCTPSDRGQSGIRLYTVCTLTAARRATEASRVSGCTLYVNWQLLAERQRPVGYQAVHCMYTDSCTPSDRGQSGIRLYAVCKLTAARRATEASRVSSCTLYVQWQLHAERQRPVGYQAVRCMYSDSCTPSDRGQSGIKLYTVCTLTAARRATEASRVSGCTLYVHWQLTPSDRGQSGIRLYAVCTLTANAERQRPVGYQAVHCMYTDS